MDRRASICSSRAYRLKRRGGGSPDRTRGGGNAAAWTGKDCFNWAGHRIGKGYTCQGNILMGAAVVDAMAETFERTGGPLPERLLAALESGQAEGGDSRGQQSAALSG